jgi:hypothetical protein
MRDTGVGSGGSGDETRSQPAVNCSMTAATTSLRMLIR